MLFSHTAGLVKRAEQLVDGEGKKVVDEYGNPVYGNPSTTPTPAWWEERESTEQTDSSSAQVVSGYWLYLPPDTDLEPVDAVELPLGGSKYEVHGEPGVQPGGFIVDGYLRVAVERVEH